MGRWSWFFLALIILLAGGAFTVLLLDQGSDSIIPATIQQVEEPQASTFLATPGQAEQLVLATGFILFNLIGMGATIALLMWLGERGIRKARAEGDSTG
ncbi:MAG: hypothetical protein OXF83_07500 [Anaerolineaceae bacterium]|nr:hypothetical protein [Anaerolineaceae bacterium]MCY3936101.1 hypothetical protein [Chloroflexota bacterium]MCY4010178.1 hypothetical protein [Anaerolineaceae bacterium]MCY4105452.1 hypothetical protein [Chloroflexota bacterium]